MFIEGATEIVERDSASIFGNLRLDGEDGDAAPLLRQPATRVEDGVMLGGLGDDVELVRRIGDARGFDHALEGEVVALRGAGGEDDFLGQTSDELRHLGAGRFDGLFGSPSEGVAAARRVAVDRREEWHHRVEDARIELRGGVVVEIDGEIHRPTLIFYEDSKMLQGGNNHASGEGY